MVSNTLVTLASLLLHGSPSSTSTENQTKESHKHTIPYGMPPPGLYLLSLVLSLSPFSSSLKVFQ